MKKPGNTSTDADLRPEYRLDCSKAKANRFAGRLGPEPVVILLEPDVAAVFHDGESVNAVLRSIVKALPVDSPRPVRSR